MFDEGVPFDPESLCRGVIVFSVGEPMGDYGFPVHGEAFSSVICLLFPW